MSSPLTDKEISELYQQRKHQVIAPSINLDALTTPTTQVKVRVKSFSQKFFIILGISSFASFSILALINQLKQPVEVHNNKSNINLQREIKLVSIKDNDKSLLTLSPMVKKVPPIPQVADQPKGEKLKAISDNAPISDEFTIISQLDNPSIEINTQISANTLNIVLVKKVQPKYPVKAQQKKLQGVVKLSYQVNSLGNVINITVNQSSNKLFTKSALKALNQWKYERYNKEDQETLSQHQIEFTFKTE